MMNKNSNARHLYSRTELLRHGEDAGSLSKDKIGDKSTCFDYSTMKS